MVVDSVHKRRRLSSHFPLLFLNKCVDYHEVSFKFKNKCFNHLNEKSQVTMTTRFELIVVGIQGTIVKAIGMVGSGKFLLEINLDCHP